MGRIASFFESIESFVNYVLTAVLVLTVLWGVLTRYVTERPAVWTTELSGMIFTWIVMIGAMVAYRSDRHIRVTIFLDMLPPSSQKIFEKLADLIIIFFLVYCIYLSWVMMKQGMTRPSPALRIPFSYVYLASLISFTVMSINAILRFFGVLATPKAHDAPIEDIV